MYIYDQPYQWQVPKWIIICDAYVIYVSWDNFVYPSAEGDRPS